MKPKIEVNFNEIIDDFKILLSQSDMIIDSEGNEILLKEGLEIDIFEPDYDEQNNRDDIVASGFVTECVNPLYKQVKWCCKIDKKEIKSPQARVSERNPLDFIPNITHRNKNYFQYDYYRTYKANQTYS